mmetsp:Transcript_123877/g.361757  ORF Transcript_123877/g.361757 Transcript_123877/m.361757 type:complete len:281 (+) Transcript_123877:66-908(+)
MLCSRYSRTGSEPQQLSTSTTFVEVDFVRPACFESSSNGEDRTACIECTWSRSAERTGMSSSSDCRTEGEGSGSMAAWDLLPLVEARGCECVVDTRKAKEESKECDGSASPSAALVISFASSMSLKNTLSRTASSSSMAAEKRSMKILEYLTRRSLVSANSRAMLRKASASRSSRSAPPGDATRWPSRVARSAQSAASQAQLPHSTLGHSMSSSSAAKEWNSREPIRTKIILVTPSLSVLRFLPAARATSAMALRHILRTAAGQTRQHVRSSGCPERCGV